MGQKSRKQRKKREQIEQTKRPVSPAAVMGKARWVWWGMIVLCLVAGIGAWALVPKTSKIEPSSAQTVSAAPVNRYEPRTLSELLALPPGELGRVDFARMNLLCAQGLPGSENLDIEACLSVLDKWADYAAPQILRHMYKFQQAPQDYESSEGYFRVLLLNTILQQDCGVHYNLDRVTTVDFRNAKDLFIHGMINDRNGGTCASIPVILTAVARRLGYPVKLVATKAHLFCRWEAPGDRINLESSCVGLNTYKDDYYRTWPFVINEQTVREEHYLVSMTPAEELSDFLVSRGHCLLDNGYTQEARDAYGAAVRLNPAVRHYRGFLAEAEKKLHPKASEIENINEMLNDMRRARLQYAEIERRANPNRVPAGEPLFGPDGLPSEKWGHLPTPAANGSAGYSPNPQNSDAPAPFPTPDQWGHLPKNDQW